MPTPPPRWTTSRPRSTSGPGRRTPRWPPTRRPGSRPTRPTPSTTPSGRSTTRSWPCWTPSTPASTPTTWPRRRAPSQGRTSRAAAGSWTWGSGPRAGGGKGGCDDKRCDILDEEPTAAGDTRRWAGAVRLLGVVPGPGDPVDPVRDVRALLPGGQPGRGGHADRGGLRGRRHHPAGGGQPGPELALAVHPLRDPGGGRRDWYLLLAGHHPVCGVDPGGLVPDRLRHHPLGRRAGWPQGGVVVDRAAARDRRAGPGGVGGAFLGAVAADPADPGRGVGHRLWGERDLRRLYPARSRQGDGAGGRLIATHRPSTSRGQLPCRIPRQG